MLHQNRPIYSDELEYGRPGQGIVPLTADSPLDESQPNAASNLQPTTRTQAGGYAHHTGQKDGEKGAYDRR